MGIQWAFAGISNVFFIAIILTNDFANPQFVNGGYVPIVIGTLSLLERNIKPKKLGNTRFII